jgi:multiple antibiotic resistance protein
MTIQVAKSILLVVSALFPILDPIGGAPVFLLLTRDYPAETRRVLARRITVNSFVLLIASYTIGSHVLSFFGISIPVVQVGGGLIVISTGWAMLNQKDGGDRDAITRRTVTCADALNQAFYPLTLPLTVGPGSISVAITLGANETAHNLAANRLRSRGGNRLSLLRLCRSACERHGGDWNECNSEAVLVSAGMHRRADLLERGEQVA